jgi:hypothetical protein
MTNPYDAGQDEHEWVDATWVGHAQSVLWFVGACYVLLGIVFMPLYGWGMSQDMPPEVGVPFAIVTGLLGLVCCGGFGVVNFVAAWGLGLRAKWAWILTLCLGAIYLTSACLPFGAVLLYAMLEDNGRKLFLERPQG